MSFPHKEAREICWNSRDKYWDCLESSKDSEKNCAELRKLYESKCPSQWVKHFDRRRQFLKYKDLLEKEGFEPVK